MAPVLVFDIGGTQIASGVSVGAGLLATGLATAAPA
jgi:hypothetical protein